MTPTAEEFLKEKCYITKDDVEDIHDSLLNVKNAMIEFAKLHCEEFREELLKNTKIKEIYFSLEDTPLSLIKEMIENGGAGRYDGYGSAYGVTVSSIDRDSIINSYPLANIK